MEIREVVRSFSFSIYASLNMANRLIMYNN